MGAHRASKYTLNRADFISFYIVLVTFWWCFVSKILKYPATQKTPCIRPLLNVLCQCVFCRCYAGGLESRTQREAVHCAESTCGGINALPDRKIKSAPPKRGTWSGCTFNQESFHWRDILVRGSTEDFANFLEPHSVSNRSWAVDTLRN